MPSSRHQCFLYDGSPSVSIPGIATAIRQRLDTEHRCLYLHSPTMVTEMRTLLSTGGTDVTHLVSRGQLVLASDHSHLLNGQFQIERMVTLLRNAVNDAVQDDYRGLFATGDMGWEFGPDQDFSHLVEYEWHLEDLFREQPALSGICRTMSTRCRLRASDKGS